MFLIIEEYGQVLDHFKVFSVVKGNECSLLEESLNRMDAIHPSIIDRATTNIPARGCTLSLSVSFTVDLRATSKKVNYFCPQLLKILPIFCYIKSHFISQLVQFGNLLLIVKHCLYLADL